MDDAAWKLGGALPSQASQLGLEGCHRFGQLGPAKRGDARQSPRDLRRLVPARTVIGEPAARLVEMGERGAGRGRVDRAQLRAGQRPPGKPRKQRGQLAGPTHERVARGCGEWDRGWHPARGQVRHDRGFSTHLVLGLALVDAQEQRPFRELHPHVGVDGPDGDRSVHDVPVPSEAAQDFLHGRGVKRSELGHAGPLPRHRGSERTAPPPRRAPARGAGANPAMRARGGPPSPRDGGPRPC